MDEKQLLYILIGIAALNLIISLMSKSENFATKEVLDDTVSRRGVAPTKAPTKAPTTAPTKATK